MCRVACIRCEVRDPSIVQLNVILNRLQIHIHRDVLCENQIRKYDCRISSNKAQHVCT